MKKNTLIPHLLLYPSNVNNKITYYQVRIKSPCILLRTEMFQNANRQANFNWIIRNY